MRHLEQEIRRQGRHWAVLQVDEGDTPARDLYQMLGYKPYHPHFWHWQHSRWFTQTTVPGAELTHSWVQRPRVIPPFCLPWNVTGAIAGTAAWSAMSTHSPGQNKARNGVVCGTAKKLGTRGQTLAHKEMCLFCCWSRDGGVSVNQLSLLSSYSWKRLGDNGE